MMKAKKPKQLCNIRQALEEYNQDKHQRLDHLLEIYFLENPVCPHCNTDKVKKWGVSHDHQRFKCKVCDKTFNALTGTPLSKLRHPEKWPLYLQDMAESLALRPSAEHCDISLHTAFLWRHRFLEALEENKLD